MTLAPLDVSRETTPEHDPAELPRGPKAAYTRAIGNGFRVRIGRGNVAGERSVREYLYDEDGRPLLTDKGGRRYATSKVSAILASVGLWLQHDEAGQGQIGWWTEGKLFEGWAWPADGSDIARRITATTLGTLVDLDQLRASSIATARAEVDERLSLAAIRARALKAAR